LLSIDSIYNIEGRGVVVTGTVEAGKCKVGDDVEIVGFKVYKIFKIILIILIN
jgi:elongation factor Tu